MAAKKKFSVEKNIKPMAGYLLVEPLKSEKQTASGIYLPESSEEKPMKGRVLAVGPDEVMDSGEVKKSPVKVGDLVIYKEWGANEVTIDSKEYVFAKYEDILAILK